MRPVYLIAAITTALLASGCNELIDVDRFTVRDAGGPQREDGGGMDAGKDHSDGGLLDAGAQDGGTHDGGFGDAGADAGGAPPSVAFLSGTVADGATTNASRVVFSFVAVPADPSSVFECQLESVTALGTTSSGFSPCSSPVQRDLVDAGLHTLSVRAQNPGTAFGPPTTRQWNLEALATDIPSIKQGTHAGTFEFYTLVKAQARVQHVFSGSDFEFDAVAIADGGGTTLASVAWHGIFTLPRHAEPPFAAGTHVTVSGRVTSGEWGTTLIEDATYERGVLTPMPYPIFYTRDSNELQRPELDGLVVRTDGHIPSSSCGVCPPVPTSGALCFETCDGVCKPFPFWTNVTAPDYGDYGYYTAGLVAGESGGVELWVFDFVEQNDACL